MPAAGAANPQVSGTLTLDQAIAMAQQRSFDAMVARLNFMSQYWSYRSFKAQLLPSVNLSASLLQFNRSTVEARNADDGHISMVENHSMSNSMSLSIDQNVVPLGGTLSVQSYLYRLDQYSDHSKIYNSQPLRMTYQQPLRAFNTLKWQRKTEPMKYEKAKRTYLEAMESITVDVVDLFFGVLSAQSQYQESVSTLADRQHLLELSKKRFTLGTVTKSDLLQLELSLLNAQVAVREKEIDLKSKLFSLFSYLRVFQYDGITLLPPNEVPEVVVSPERCLEKALANSPHLLTQQLQVLDAEKTLKEAKASRGLQVQLSAELGLNRTANSLSEAYRRMNDNEIVGLTLSLPIFDWGVSRGRVRMAQADLEATRTQMEQAHEQYVQNLQTSVLRFNMQGMQCGNARRAQDIATERYDITKRRFEVGGITVTDLNTAQQEAETARAQYIQQLRQFWNGYYTLRKATLYDWIHHTDLSTDFDEVVNTGSR